MEIIPMVNDGPRDKALSKQLNSYCDEKKGVGNEVEDEGKNLGSFQEGDLKINGVEEQINSGFEEANHVSPVSEKQQPQGSIIQWEDFLPKRSLKVMLVEDDDSTRHVVTALLRNCSYEVIPVANGLQAWKILEDMTNHIDLILTEVAMPILSGIGLLCKIMNHKTFKNIPVIMMSSHDSMGLVFRCLSKGAVDFLVKPIRKNELKNLWQHIWRRCHSSSGSGSESGTQTKTYATSKSNDQYGNNMGSSDERENGSIGLSIPDRSDDGSGTQSSWTRAADVDNARQISHRDQLADTPDSTCAQVIHINTETFISHWVQATETKEFKELDKKKDNVAMGKDLEMCTSKFPESHPDYQHKCLSRLTDERKDKLSELDNLLHENEQLDYRSEQTSGKLMNCSVKLTSLMINNANAQMESQAIERSTDNSDVSQNKNKASSGSREFPSLELTLEGQRGAGNVRTTMHDGCKNVLRHSDLSAFSKYNTASSASQTPTGNIGSCSPLDNSSVALKTQKMHHSLNQQSNGSSNNNDMAYTLKSISRPEALNDKLQSVSAFKCFHSSTVQPAQNVSLAPQQLISTKTDGVTVGKEEVHARGSDQQFVQHHHHHYHHYHHHVRDLQHQSLLDQEDHSPKNMMADASQCGSSNMLGWPVEANGKFHTVNGSASESNRSSGRNGSSNGLNTGAPNMESDNGATGNSGVICTNGGASGNGTDGDWLAQREAALKKFRQKRKERCFEKKVRYQSRKKLAEQRPRVRGQFVRHIGSDSKAVQDEQDNLAPKDSTPNSEQ